MCERTVQVDTLIACHSLGARLVLDSNAATLSALQLKRNVSAASATTLSRSQMTKIRKRRPRQAGVLLLACSSASTICLHLAISSSVVCRIRLTAWRAFLWRGIKGARAGTFHRGNTSVALCSVSFNAVYTACSTVSQVTRLPMHCLVVSAAASALPLYKVFDYLKKHAISQQLL